MGGEGSGRTIGTEKRVNQLLGFNQPADTDNAVVYLPNYSGIKDSVRKDNLAGWTAGSVVFVGATGDFTQDNANLFWDNSNNRLGIGTASPDVLLHLSSTGNTALKINSATGSNSDIQFFEGGTGKFAIYAQGSDDTLRFYKYTATAGDVMTITSTGLVGIGTTLPTNMLHVAGNSVSSPAGVPAVWLHNANNVANTDGVVISSVNDGSDAEVLHVRTNNTTYSNGTSLMLVRGDGNVGIGTTAPVNPLHVHKAAGTASTIRITNSDTGATAGDGFEFGLASDEGVIFENYENTYMSFYTNNLERVRILSGGNVGIGTTTPYGKLTVDGTSAEPSLTVSTTSTTSFSNNIGTELALTGSASTPYTISLQTKNNDGGGPSGISYPLALNPLGGNVGIGTTTPDSKVHISGGSTVYSKTTAPTLVTGSGAVFISGGTGGTVEYWLKGPTTQTRLGTVS